VQVSYSLKLKFFYCDGDIDGYEVAAMTWTSITSVRAVCVVSSNEESSSGNVTSACDVIVLLSVETVVSGELDRHGDSQSMCTVCFLLVLQF